MKPPPALIHVDIDAKALGRNYPAAVAIHADARAFVEQLLPIAKAKPRSPTLEAAIAAGHARLETARRRRGKGKVTPAALFAALQRHASPDAVYAADSGNGLFLAMEHLRLTRPGCFIGPVDFSCMGYAVPAAIGAKFANPGRDAIALPGDGALLMTGLELLTAATYKAAPAVFVLRDRELAQIVQLQRTTFNRDTCSVLGDYHLDKLAAAVNAHFASVRTDDELDHVVPTALSQARNGQPVVVEVAIDYSQKTYFTKSVIETNFWRLPWPERLRMAARAAERRLPLHR
jgi:acetolactate synthase-1/2/3 large subunit